MEAIIKFRKSADKILHYHALGYFQWKQLEPDVPLTTVSDIAVIEAVIKTPYHHWMGENHPLGQTRSVSSTNAAGRTIHNTLRNQKFYGYYDAEKIAATDYRQIDETLFILLLENEIVDNIAGDDADYLQEVQQGLVDILKNNPLIFYLALDPQTDKEKVSMFSVYSCFIGFLLIDRKANKVTLVNVGDD